jgi:hypothetical protein
VSVNALGIQQLKNLGFFSVKDKNTVISILYLKISKNSTKKNNNEERKIMRKNKTKKITTNKNSGVKNSINK